MGRTLGLDVGTKTIGVAVSDEMGWTAQGLSTLARRGRAADLEALRRLAAEWEVERIVIGLPKNMNGTLGPQAALVLEFAEAVKAALGLPVVTWDERLSTVAANRALLEADVSRRKRKAVVDTVAAALILQGYLDRQASIRASREGPADDPD
jgi:putative Holliday junction resolvase